MSTEVAVEKEDRLAAVLIFLVSLFFQFKLEIFSKYGNTLLQTAFIGVMVNFFIAIYMRHIPSLRNSFGRLLQVQVMPH